MEGRRHSKRKHFDDNQQIKVNFNNGILTPVNLSEVENILTFEEA